MLDEKSFWLCSKINFHPLETSQTKYQKKIYGLTDCFGVVILVMEQRKKLGSSLSAFLAKHETAK